ncbi:MAG: helix-turn-helix transcriptional regulator [Bacteroidota bacterium]
MSKYRLGEFEEVILLTVAILAGGAYSIAIIDDMEMRLKRKVSVGSLQTALRRLEQKGFLNSEFGEATQQRGGKRKRFFTLTNSGKEALKEVKNQRLALWNAIPSLDFNLPQ